MTRIRAVIFDYGGVLTLPPQAPDRERICAMVGGREPDFWQIYWRHRAGYDAGEIDGADYWQRVADDLGAGIAPDALQGLIAADIVMWNRLNHAMLQWAAGLAQAGVRLGVLSNMHRDHAAALRADKAHLARFTSLAISSELRMAKPDPAIYRYCLRELAAAAGETLFIDDRAVNVAGAQAVGIGAILFTSNQQLAADLATDGWFAPDLLAPLRAG